MPSSPLCKKLQVQKSCPIKGSFSMWILDSLSGTRSREVQPCGAQSCARGLFTLSSLIISVVTLGKETCKGIHREGTSPGKQACPRHITNLPPSSPSTYMLKVSFDTFLFWPCISFPLLHKNTNKQKTSTINQQISSLPQKQSPKNTKPNQTTTTINSYWLHSKSIQHESKVLMLSGTSLHSSHWINTKFKSV